MRRDLDALDRELATPDAVVSWRWFVDAFLVPSPWQQRRSRSRSSSAFWTPIPAFVKRRKPTRPVIPLVEAPRSAGPVRMTIPASHDDVVRGGAVLPVGHLERIGYRLPTDAEWEFAARAGASASRFFGTSEELLREYAWYAGNTFAERSWPVGQLKPNDLGLFDVASYLRSAHRGAYVPDERRDSVGFRVARTVHGPRP
jgi:hypothetical protein